MFMFISILLTSSISFECVNESIDTGRSYYNQSISIFLCSFSRLSSFQSKGGVICIENDNMHLLVSYTSFYNAQAPNGGAIYH